jgi:hypothetical protein
MHMYMPSSFGFCILTLLVLRASTLLLLGLGVSLNRPDADILVSKVARCIYKIKSRK